MIRVNLNEYDQLGKILAQLVQHNISFSMELRGNCWEIQTFTQDGEVV